MTVCVAIPTGESTILATDSGVVSDGTSILKTKQKLYHPAPFFAMAFSGNMAARAMFENQYDEWDGNDEDRALKAPQSWFEDVFDRVLCKKRLWEYEWEALVVFPNRIFILDDNRTFLEVEGETAIGSGSHFALASLEENRYWPAPDCDPYELRPHKEHKWRALRAVSIACKLSPGCYEPIQVVEVKNG